MGGRRTRCQAPAPRASASPHAHFRSGTIEGSQRGRCFPSLLTPGPAERPCLRHFLWVPAVGPPPAPSPTLTRPFYGARVGSRRPPPSPWQLQRQFSSKPEVLVHFAAGLLVLSMVGNARREAEGCVGKRRRRRPFSQRPLQGGGENRRAILGSVRSSPFPRRPEEETTPAVMQSERILRCVFPRNWGDNAGLISRPRRTKLELCLEPASTSTGLRARNK